METSMAKSQFLCLAYQTQVGGSIDRGHLEVMETKVCHLCDELEASQRLGNESIRHEAQAR